MTSVKIAAQLSESFNEPDFVLLPEVEETGEYGWRWGSENNRDSVEAEFEQVESDIVLSYRGYDIDNATEVSVLLNGELLEFMPRSGNNTLGGATEIAIAAEAQQPGTNTVSFVQRTSGWIWGVTAISINELVSNLPANIAPIASSDIANVIVGDSVIINVLGNDADEDGTIDSSSVIVTQPPSYGVADVQGGGSVLYTPNLNSDVNSDSFSYTVADNQGAISNIAQVSVAIEPVPNLAPVAVDDEVTVIAGVDTFIDVLSNDSDDGIPSGVLTVVAGSLQPSHGSISIDPVSGGITFSSNAMMVALDAVDQFSYALEDEAGLVSNPATVTVTFKPGPVVHTHHEMIPNPVFNSNIRVSEACKGVTQSCDWSSASTWATGSVPDGDSRVIVDGHVQIRDLDALAHSIGVYPMGELSFASNVNTQLNVADLLVFQGGALEIGTESSPIGSSVSAEVVFRDLPFGATDSKEHLRGLVTIDGKVTVHGHELEEVFIRAAGEPASSANVIALSQSAENAGWREGDTVVIPNSKQCAFETTGSCADMTEERTISLISANNIMLDQPLEYDHPGARDHNGVLDFTPHVVNKTRNVVFRSENPDGVRGHLLLHGRSDIDIRYAEFQSLGRTDINDLGPTNQKGRYPVHAHHLIGPREVPENGYQFTLIGNTVDFGEENRQADQDRKWGISIHGSHYGLIERNVVDYASGAGIVTESGEEMGNRFSKNFVVRVINGNGEREEDRDPSDGSKLGRAGSAYWFNGGGRNHFDSNVAAAVYECEFCYGFKFDNIRNSEFVFPREQGSDPFMEGGDIVSASTVGIPDFDSNEAYSVPNGLTIWWKCTFGDFPEDNDICRSDITSFSVWHHHRLGYFGYPANNMTIENFVVRGDPSVLVNRFESVTGLTFSDYMSRNVKIINADIQNVRTAIEMPSMRGSRSESADVGFTTVENSYLVASVGLDVLVPASVNGAVNLPPQTSVIRDVRFASIDPSGELGTAHIRFNDSTFFEKNTSLRNDVWIFNYNGAPGAGGVDLYAVPGYANQGPDRCDDSIGDCSTEVTDSFGDIRQGHVYPLGENQGNFPPGPDPDVGNTAPIAEAGLDRTVASGVDVVLNGSNSVDPDGSIDAYQWSQNGVVVGTEVELVLSGLPVSTYTINLLVTDNDGATATDTVVIQVSDAELIANDDEGILLDVTSSVPVSVFDNDLGWEGSHDGAQDAQIETNVSDLESAANLQAQRGFLDVDQENNTITYTPYAGDPGGGSDSFGYRFRVGSNLSNIATVTITFLPIASPVNEAPVADAGSDQTVGAGTDVTLDGSNSNDTDGSIESYLWTENGVDIGTGEIVVLGSLAVGTHQVDLIVTDNLGATAADSVAVTVNDLSGCSPAGTADETISLLMIGDSLMNDIESKLEQLLDCGGYTSDIDTYNPDGHTLDDHDADDQTTITITEGYDLTLLQEMSSDFLNRVPPYETISALDSKITSALSGMGFYQTWGLESRSIEETESILSAYETVANFFDAPIIHIGRAWDYFYTLHSEEPPFSLYLDEANPSEEGKALVAYVVYAYVTGESPLLAPTLGLDAEDALLLQNVAWDSYQLYGLQFQGSDR